MTGKNPFGLSDGMKEQLAAELLARHARKKEKKKANARLPKKPVRKSLSGRNDGIPDEFCRFDKFPNYEEIRVIESGGKQLGIKSPFFKTHDQSAGATTQIAGQEYINFASYNYLDLCGHPQVNQAAKDAIDRYGTSASASRMVSGERAIQQELERSLADLYEVDDCVAFVSGHATNVTTIGYLFEKPDLILHDALVHNSILQGIQLSGARRMSFAHNDWEALETLLEQHRKDFERVLIVVEGIYSMDGDFPDLPEFVRIKRQHKAFLMVDEAHSLGVMGATGKGIREHFGVAGKDVDIWMGTMSKTLSGCGGYIAGEQALVHHLRISAPGFLYSVGMSPTLAAAANESLKLMLAEPERVKQLQANGKRFVGLCQQVGIDTGVAPGFAVIPAILGGSARAGMVANQMFDRGINVQPIFYPAVEEGMARLRFFISSAHTEEQLRYTVDALSEILAAKK
ncbi:MAG: 8-amino-7-oxononanoate synthase (EC [uncultured Thiotrichaceae bacterium]|uniref:8-amino-7-oxononanoate synthase (EC) n=1 Tax=uncultured Thiotrichaceae bacterium TaxID=298394 RepID=A0A6S6TM82_9GAMM|nr:MAG: 8-amino-7-oxononanoate synthase (EC [uncultured Thiotrichaceae bacterium]